VAGDLDSMSFEDLLTTLRLIGPGFSLLNSGPVLLGFGGQTALNCGLELDQKGVLKKHDA
jgi:hypothetical protein